VQVFGPATVSFDERDQELIALLGNHFDRSGNLEIDVMTLPQYGEWGAEDLRRRIDRFKGFQMIEHLANDHLRVLPNLLDVAQQFKSPLQQDYWKKCENWFRSRWWSLPMFAIVVLLPLIVQWIEMIKQVLAGFGVR
jgi:hypothetical protein